MSNPGASLNLLWALEGALTGLHRQVVSREHRTSLLLALDELQETERAQLEVTKAKAMKGVGKSGVRNAQILKEVAKGYKRRKEGDS